ncbi:MAG TPA: hypothetical protein VGD41_04280, partial [Pyrinomonadaceae bacterium]
ESHLFTFSVWKRNKLVYTSETAFHRKRDCDRKVKALRAVMEDKQHYKSLNSCGTFWVSVIDMDKNLLCESTSLRSEEDAFDLIKESIDKIPYCKYNRG